MFRGCLLWLKHWTISRLQIVNNTFAMKGNKKIKDLKQLKEALKSKTSQELANEKVKASQNEIVTK